MIMKINEVEKILEIPKASIRFYEKEGLLTPRRTYNKYRDYSDEDLERLKRIIVFRKIGLAVEDIKKVFSDEISLQDALIKNTEKLQEQKQEIEGAIKICELMRQKNESINSFDQSYYWDVIHTEERKGNRFFEIVNDIAEYEKTVINDEFGLFDENGKLKFSPIVSVLIVLFTCLAGGLLWFFLDGMHLTAFAEGFLMPFVTIVIVSIFGLPLHFLKKKHPRAAEIIRKIGYGICVVSTIALLALVIFDVFYNL